MQTIIDEYKNYLIFTKKASKNTIESYVRDIRNFCEYILIQIDSPEIALQNDILAYVEFLKSKDKSTATIIRVITSIKSFYSFLMEEGKASENPAKNIRIEKEAKKIPDILTHEEIDIYLGQPDVTTPKGCRDRAILEIMYASGIKVSELINIKIDDLNLQSNLITCENEKFKRVIPINDTSSHWIKKYIREHRPNLISNNEDILFVNINGGQMTRQGVWKIIKSYADCEEINKKITPYILRHSFAIHMLENGAKIKNIQHILGYSDASSAKMYVQMVKDRLDTNYKSYHPRGNITK